MTTEETEVPRLEEIIRQMITAVDSASFPQDWETELSRAVTTSNYATNPSENLLVEEIGKLKLTLSNTTLPDSEKVQAEKKVELFTQMLIKLKTSRLYQLHFKTNIDTIAKANYKPLLHLLAKLVVDNYSPLKCGKGEYCEGVASVGRDKEYLGHNIVAMAVDHTSQKIVAIEYNLVDDLASPLEHAEQRLIRRLFADDKYLDYRNGRALQNIDLFTSLEPCQQCSGICLLANVSSVLWLQTDPRIKVIIDQMGKDDFSYHVATSVKRGTYDDNAIVPPMWTTPCRFLYATGDELYAPLKNLEEEYQKWQERCYNSKEELFFVGTEKKLRDCDGIPYFLCTQTYYEIIKKMADNAPKLEEHQKFDDLQSEANKKSQKKPL